MRRRTNNPKSQRNHPKLFHRRVARPYMRRRGRLIRRGIKAKVAIKKRYVKMFFRRCRKISSKRSTSMYGLPMSSSASGVFTVRNLSAFGTVLKPYKSETAGQANFTTPYVIPARNTQPSLFPSRNLLDNVANEVLDSMEAYYYHKLIGVKVWLRNVSVMYYLEKDVDNTFNFQYQPINCNAAVTGFAHTIDNKDPNIGYQVKDSGRLFKVTNGKIKGAIPVCFKKINGRTFTASGLLDAPWDILKTNDTYAKSWIVINRLEKGALTDAAFISTWDAVIDLSNWQELYFCPQVVIQLIDLPHSGLSTFGTVESPASINISFTGELCTEVIFKSWNKERPDNAHSNITEELVKRRFKDKASEFWTRLQAKKKIVDKSSKVDMVDGFSLPISGPSIVLPGTTSDPLRGNNSCKLSRDITRLIIDQDMLVSPCSSTSLDEADNEFSASFPGQV